MVESYIVLYGKFSIVILIPLIISLISSFTLLSYWIKIAKERNFVGKDMNKLEEIYVPEAGGICVSFSILLGILLYLFLKRYILLSDTNIDRILTILVILLLASFLGFIDDILGWKKGLKPWQKVIFTFPISIPLVVMKFGYSKITIPFIGTIDFGILYPLLLIPIGIIGAANAFNMLAGYNGLEASLAIILFLNLFLKFLFLNELWLAYLSLIVIFSIIAFLKYNWYPAKVFPGDAFTYSIGSLFATFVILGNIEKFGLLLFILYFLEFLLFLRGIKKGIYKENFGIPLKDGSLKEPYKEIYSVTHLAIRILRKLKGKAYEKEVTFLIILIQLVISIVAWLI